MNRSVREFSRKKKWGFVLPVCFAVILCLLSGFSASAAEETGMPLELKPMKMVLAQGQSFHLPGELAPEQEEAAERITWQSSRPEIVMVDSRGVVTAVNPGIAVVTAGFEETVVKYTIRVRLGVKSDKTIRKKTGSWKKQYGKKYYVLKDGSMAVGARKINGTAYVFDQNGALQQPKTKSLVNIGTETYYVLPNGKAVAGWHILGEKLYYMDSRGKMLKNTTVEGIRLAKSGAARNSSRTKWQMTVSRVVDAITKDSMTKEKKLRACWNYLVNKKHFTYGGEIPNMKKKEWWKKTAYEMLTNRVGNCYYFACTYAAMAHTIGCEAYVVSGEMEDWGGVETERFDGMTAHAWVIIDKKYYDPELSFVDAWPEFYAYDEYSNNPHNVLKVIRYAE